MENQSLRKRLYQNLNQKPLKPTYLLESEPKSPSVVLRPKILQETVVEPQKSPIILLNKGKNLISNVKAGTEVVKKKVIKPKEVQLEKLSKEAKSLIDEGKIKIKNNLKPHQIFAFYDAFPEMIEDFFYLNRLTHPYDYQIVSYAKRNPTEYMTISSQGVTLYHDKEAEFLTRREWLEDQKIYYKLQKIDFFNQYKLSKNFSIWKNKMKLHYMKEMSSILNEKLFFTSEHPCMCLKEVRKSVLFLEDCLAYLPVENHEPLSWKELLEISNKYQNENLVKKIGEIEKRIVEDLELAIEKEIKNFKENNKIKIEGLNSKEENKEGYVYSQEAILRKQYKRVLKLIKVSESMLLESKIELIHRWMKQMIEKLREVEEGSLREDWITMIFKALPPQKDACTLSWDPTYEEFISTFKRIINNSVEIICSNHQSILAHPSFEKYRNSEEQQLMGKEDKHNSLKNLIEESVLYHTLMDEIQELLDHEYQEVKKQEQLLHKFIEIYAKHRSIDHIQDLIADSNAAQISVYVREWQQDNQQMQDLPDRYSGMIRYDYSIIRKTMMGVAQDSLSELFSFLPLRLTDVCHRTEKKVKELLESINIIPNDSNFVEFTKAVKKASEDLDGIIETGKQIKQILILLDDNRRPNLDIHRANMKEVMSGVSELKTKVDEANAKFDHRLSKFKKDIELTIGKIKTSIKENKEKFESIESKQNEDDSDQVISKINTTLPQIEQIEKQANNIHLIEQELALHETDFNDAHRLYQRVKVVNKLWLCKKEWKELTQDIEKVHYTKVDCDLLTTKLNQFTTQSEYIKEKLEDSEFLKKLVEDLGEFQVLIELIRALQNKNLDEKAWKQISEYLAYEIEKIQDNPNEYPLSNPSDSMYTVEWLNNNKIPLYKEKIEFIVKKSEKENELVNTHAIIKTYINSLTLDFVSKKRELFILGQNRKTFRELDDHLVSLLEIFNNEYSESVKKETKLLSKHYEYVIQILEAVREFGENWEKLEDLFDPSRPYSKQLNKESKDFSNWENSWKKIIKNIMMDGWSKKMSEENLGITPSRTTMKAVTKANACWDSIKKGVEEFLDRRRAILHHYFYFTDSQLLQLLSMADPAQQFTPNLVPLIYENIESIQLDKDTDMLVSVRSKDGEELKVGKLITCKIVSEFEEILRSCEEHWKKFLVATIKKVFNDFVSAQDEEVSRKKVITDNITQVALAFDHIIWVKLAEETYLCAEPLGSLLNWIEIQQGQINDLYQMLRDSQASSIDCKKVEQLLLQAIYLRDKTEHFAQTKTQSLGCYEWERTLKMCDGTGNMHEKLYLKVMDSHVFYGGEFLGCSQRQYICPDSDKSFINLVLSLHSRKITVLNGNFQAIKELSLLAAQTVRAFHLNDNQGMRMLGRILAGTCSQGSWAVFHPPSSEELLSLLANQLSLIQNSMLESNNSIQLGKYNANLNQSVFPSFFVMRPADVSHFYSCVSYEQFRSVSVSSPNAKNLLMANTSILDRNEEIGRTIGELNELCAQLFGCDNYERFDYSFGVRILKQFRESGSTEKELKKNIIKIMKRILKPQLTPNDDHLFNLMIQAYDETVTTRMKSKRTLVLDLMPSDRQLEEYIAKHTDKQNKESFIRDANYFYSALSEPTNRSKKIILTGDNLSGKSSVIQVVSEFVSQEQRQEVKISRIYYGALKHEDLVKCDRGQSILSRVLSETNSEQWVIFDGPINAKTQLILESLSEKAVLDRYGVLDMESEQNRKKIIIETTNLSQLPPNFAHTNSIVCLSKNEGKVLDILKGGIVGIGHTTCEEKSRIEEKNDDTSVEVKYFERIKKPVGVCNQMLEYLGNQLGGMIERIAPSGEAKIKSVELLYKISSLELAFKCCKLVEAILKMNWDSIKEKDKQNKRLFDRFALWVIFWTLSGLVSPDDLSKFEKSLSDLLKVQGFDDIATSVIYPGSGLEVSSLNNQRAQSALPNIPGRGVPTNLLTQSWMIFESRNSLKNKFYEEIYLDQPHSIRVNTEESTLFSYFSLISSHNKSQVAIYGPPGSGKKSIVELFNKNNQEKYESYSLRAKWYDPYFISQSIHRPFTKLVKGKSICLKPTDISREVYISIEDVNLTPQSEPTTQFLRMLMNEEGLWINKSEWVTIRQFVLSFIISQIDSFNRQKVSFNRFLSKTNLLQVKRSSCEKIVSIFGPIIETWGSSTWEDPDAEEARIFVTRNGDGLIDATATIFGKAADICKSYGNDTVANRIKSILYQPKIQDICSGIINIFETEDPCSYSTHSFMQLWAHETLRVFGDKFNTAKDKEELIQQIKKESLLKFKENFILPHSHFIYTALGTADERYTECQNINTIYQELEQRCPQGSLPILFDEMVEEIVKFYRIISMQSGHAMLITPFHRPTRQLWKLASFLKDSTFHAIESGSINFETHIFPSVLSESTACLFLNSPEIDQQTLYLISCLLNRNYYEVEVSPENRERVKNKMIKIAQDGITRDLDSAQGNSPNKNAKQFLPESNFSPESLKISEQTQKIEHHLNRLMCEEFNQHSHFAISLNPVESSSIAFLHNNMSIVKHMQVCWHEFEDSSIYTVGENMIKENFANEHPHKKDLYTGFDEKCRRIYGSLTEEQRNRADYLKFLSSAAKLFYLLNERVEEELGQAKAALNKLNENKSFLESCIKQGEKLQSELEDLVKKQDALNTQIHMVGEEEAEKLERLEGEMRGIKNEKQILEQNSRQVRTSEKIYEDLIALFPTSEDLTTMIAEKEDVLRSSVEDSILTQAALLYLNNHSQNHYLPNFNIWLSLLQQNELTRYSQILDMFEKVCGREYVRIPTWNSFGVFAQLKGIHFLYNLLALQEDMSDSVFCNETVVINDPEQYLSKMLLLITEKGSVYSDFRLVAQVSKASTERELALKEKEMIEKEKDKEKKEKTGKINQRSEIFAQMEKQLHKSKNGLIFVRKEELSLSLTDLATFEKILRQRKIEIHNRVIFISHVDPTLTIEQNKDYLHELLTEKSLEIEFGESTVLERRKSLTTMKEISIKQAQLLQNTVKSCLIDLEEKASQVLNRLKNEAREVSKIKNRVQNILREARMIPKDAFIIDWIIQFLPTTITAEILSSCLEIYEFIKKYMMEINCSRENAIQSIGEIEPDVLRQWECLIRANVLEGRGLKLKDLVKYYMPIQSKSSLIFVNQSFSFEKNLLSSFGNDMQLQFVNLQSLKNVNGIVNESAISNENAAKKLYAFTNYYSSQRNVLFELIEKLKDSSISVFIVLTNLAEQAIRKDQELTKSYKMLFSTLECTEVNLVSDEGKTKWLSSQKDKVLKSMKRDFEEGESEILNDVEMTEEQESIESIVSNFLLIVAGRQTEKFSLDFPLSHLKKKAKLIKSKEQIQKWVQDLVPELPEKWREILSLLMKNNENKRTLEIDELLHQCETRLKQFCPSLPTPRPQQEKQYIFRLNPSRADVESRIMELPYAFNGSEFTITFDPLALLIIEMSEKFNQRRAYVKKYCQECLKIINGVKYNYKSEQNEFGLYLPSSELVSSLCQEWKVLKKAMQFLGIVANIETSSNNIRATSSVPTSQPSNLSSISASAFSGKGMKISNKFLLASKIRACRKLKISLKQLGVEWRILDLNATFNFSIIPELPIIFNTSQSKVQLLMIPYDPSQPVEAGLQLAKTMSKKEKQKRKQENVKQMPVQTETKKEKVRIMNEGEKLGWVGCEGGEGVRGLLEEQSVIIC